MSHLFNQDPENVLPEDNETMSFSEAVRAVFCIENEGAPTYEEMQTESDPFQGVSFPHDE